MPTPSKRLWRLLQLGGAELLFGYTVWVIAAMYSQSIHPSLAIGLWALLGLGLWRLWVRRIRAEQQMTRHAVALTTANAHLAQVSAKAEAANIAKDQFLASMSHELRTPLHAIAGYTQLLAMEVQGPLNAAQRQSVTRIEQNQQHLLSVITDILDFASISAGHIPVQVSLVDVAEVVHSVLSMTHELFTRKQLHVTTHGEALVVLADRDKLRQVLLNLVSNAIKFTPADGQVALTWEVTPDQRRALIHVTDTGVGIPPEYLNSIFLPFTRLGGAKVEGTGLGLSIARDYLRRMQGDVAVTSTMGAGSTFTVALPSIPMRLSRPADRVSLPEAPFSPSEAL